MFNPTNDSIRDIELKKLECLKEMSDAKDRILKELSGVDKITLTRLRQVLDDYNNIDYNVSNKVTAIETFTNELNKRSEENVKKFEDSLNKIDYLSNYVTPQMFGAKGDGINNDTLAIQSAIDYSLINSTIVYLPKVKDYYKISKSLVVESDTTIISNGAIIKCSEGNYAENCVGYGVFSNKSEDDSLINVTLDGITIYVDRYTWHGVYFHANNVMENITLKNITVYNPKWDGVLCHGCDSVPYDSDRKAYTPNEKVNLRYKIIDCKFINEYIEEKTRTGVMIENCHNAIIKNCYVRGFHTGFHCEGSSDIVFDSCVGEDNNNDYHRNDGLYNADFMIGRVENVTMTNCKSRRITKESEFNYEDISGTIRYNSLYIPNSFLRGFKIIGCSFVGGLIKSDIADKENIKKIGLTFIGCDFDNCSFNITSTTNELDGLIINACKFENTPILLSKCKNFNITNNVFINPSLTSVEISSSSYGNIINNVLKGGKNTGTLTWKKGIIVYSGCSDLNINNNNFITNEEYSGGNYTIGFYGENNRVKIINNNFDVISGYVLASNDSNISNNCIIVNNIIKYSNVGDEKGFQSSKINTDNSIIENNIIEE